MNAPTDVDQLLRSLAGKSSGRFVVHRESFHAPPSPRSSTRQELRHRRQRERDERNRAEKQRRSEAAAKAEDERDLEIVAERMAEIERDPSQLVRGPELESELASME